MSRPSLKKIRSAANILFKEDVGIKTRKRELLRKRQVVHYVAHKIFGHSQEKTGLEIGLKDHATVLHSCKVIANEIPRYIEIKDYVRKLTNMCRSKELPISPDVVIFDLLKSKTVDPNIKVELRRILKLMKDESN